MTDLDIKLRNLKLKKAMLFSNIEMLSEVNESTFAEFGKIEAEILKAEKLLIRSVENDFDV
jgi:hypothetical protein